MSNRNFVSATALFLSSIYWGVTAQAQTISTDRFTGVSECVVEIIPTKLKPSIDLSEVTDFLAVPGGIIFKKSDSVLSYQLLLYVMAFEPFGVRGSTIDFLIDDTPFRVSEQIDYHLQRDPPTEISLWALPREFVENLQSSKTADLRINASRGTIEGSIASDDMVRISNELRKCLKEDW